MNLPIFSVVVPVYNVANYLPTCLDSVLAQTFKNFEIICVNDGSTDHSLSVLNAYSDARIKIITQKNMGLAAARNTGIQASRGLFVALLDSDDFWHPEKLSEHFTHFKFAPNVDVSYSASLFVDEDNQCLGVGQFPQLTDIDPGIIYCRNPVGNGSAPVIRKSFLNRMAETVEGRNGLRVQYFDESMRQSEDVEFWLRSALQGKAVFEGIGKPLTYYRVNESGLSADVEKQLKSWQYIEQKNSVDYPEFFYQYQSRAEAYQKRYLARRAVHSGEGLKALKLINQSLVSCPDIFISDPLRSVGTYVCALLSLLPRSIYKTAERLSMSAMGRIKLAQQAPKVGGSL